MPSSNGFDIDFEFPNTEDNVEEIVIEISRENFYFKREIVLPNDPFRPFTQKSRTLEISYG